jgi:hypothetical protein
LNAVANAFMETRILWRDSAISFTNAIGHRRNLSRQQPASLCKNSQTRSGRYNSARRGKMISSASGDAGAAVFPDNIRLSMSRLCPPPVVSGVFILFLYHLVISGESLRSRCHSKSFDIGSASVSFVDFP